MPLTDLKGTTWRLSPNRQAPSGYGIFSVNGVISFITPRIFEELTELRIGYDRSNEREQYITWKNSTELVQASDGFRCVIFFTGGADTTNAALISWVQENGEMVKFTDTTITYNGNEIARLKSGQTATLECSKKIMEGDIVITFGADGTISYNGIYYTNGAPHSGQIATLPCSGLYMRGDVEVCIIDYVEEEPQTDLAGLYDADDNLVASWDTLVNTYGMDCEKDYTSSNHTTDTACPYYVLRENSELSNGVKLIIADDVTSIGDYAFTFCTTLTSITIPDGVTSIGESAFSRCDSLTSITIPGSVKNIDKHAFSSCESLVSVMICEGVTSVADYAFDYCVKLESISIPNSVTRIGNLFYNCVRLQYNEYDNAYYLGNESNPYHALIKAKESGVVTSCEIHPATKVVRGFDNRKLLTGIVIPDAVVSIEHRAFYKCESLSNAVIGESVTSIGEWAFYGCTSLTSMNFEGTVAQWNAITFGNDWNYKVPATYVTCSDGTVTL
jgi:hypothetical protein